MATESSQQKASRNATSAAASQRLAKCGRILTEYFAKWQLAFPNYPAGAKMMAVYLEFLADLGPDCLAIGCREASLRMREFPKPGHIREAIPSRQEYAGLPQLSYPEITQEERDRAIEITRPLIEELKRRLSVPNKKPGGRLYGGARLGARRPARSWEEQKAEARKRGFLK